MLIAKRLRMLQYTHRNAINMVYGGVRLTHDGWLRSLQSLRATARERDTWFPPLAKSANGAPDAVAFL